MLHLPYDRLKKMDELGKKGIPFLFIISYNGKDVQIWQKEEIPEWIKFSVPLFEYNQGKFNHTIKNFRFKISPVSFREYLKSFNKVMFHIKRGDTYLINLTMPTAVDTSLTLSQIYEFSNAQYKLLLDDTFVCFSPEIFVRIMGDIIQSFPMKGTIDASVPDAEEIILKDEKELAEHNTIVDLIRNDLCMVAEKVRVTRYRFTGRINTNLGSLLQVSSEISGVLYKRYRGKIGTIMSLLLPAGSVTGAPKEKTVEIINNVEFHDRGYYTGIFGWFDGKNVDSGVMIRFIEKDTGLIYKSGGGITYMSDPVNEYEEMIKKVYAPFSGINKD
ncbi:MAG: aminodeoxychorismate synthase component I [Bacteroidales bacterium]